MSTNPDDNAPRHPLVKKAVAMLTARHASLMALSNQYETAGREVTEDISGQHIEAFALQRAAGALAELDEATEPARIPEALQAHARRLGNKIEVIELEQMIYRESPDPVKEFVKYCEFQHRRREQDIERAVHYEVRAIITLVLEGGEFWEHR